VSGRQRERASSHWLWACERCQITSTASDFYSATTGADQKVGRDAVERYAVLRRELDAAQAQARAAIGPEPPGWVPAPQPRQNPPAPADDDES